MINIKIGEQKPFNYTMKIKETGLPVNLVSSTILFQVKADENQTSDFLIEKVITETSNPILDGKIFDAQNGRFSIFLTSEDTLKLDVGREYFYTIWRIFEHRKEVISASGMKVESFNVCPA